MGEGHRGGGPGCGANSVFNWASVSHLCPEGLGSLSSRAALLEKVGNGRGGRGNKQSPACVKAGEVDCSA